MVGVRVREQDRVKAREFLERNAGRGDTRQYAAKARVEVGVGEKPCLADLDEQGCVAEVGDMQGASQTCNGRARRASIRRLRLARRTSRARGPKRGLCRRDAG